MAPDRTPASKEWRQALWILGAATLIRLVVGALYPLVPDETYYWAWSRELSAGYFDHPPVIALLIRGGTAIFGDTAFGVRFFPMLAGTGCAWAVMRTARLLDGDSAGRVASLVFAVLPLATAGFVLATPDAPMLCAMAWSMYFVVAAVDVPALDARHKTPDTRRSWLFAGICAGLAMSSKITAVLFPLAVFVAFILHGKLQNRFAQAGPYLAVAAASVVMIPVLWWNARNDWVSFRFQLGHGLGAPKGGALGALNRELELIGGQLALVTPILLFFALRATRDALRFSEEGVRLVLGVAVATPLVLFLFSASRRPVEANWPAMAWIPAIVLLAGEPPEWSRRARRWFTGGAWFAGVLSAVVCIHAVVPILPLQASRDQMAKAFGWDLVARTVAQKRDGILNRQGSGRDLFIAAERYQDASELAFHLPGHQPVLSLNLTGRPNQYDLWPPFRERAEGGAVLLLILDDEREEPRVIRKLQCCFARIDQSESVALMRGNEAVSRKRIWILTGWSGGWPPRDQPFPWTD